MQTEVAVSGSGLLARVPDAVGVQWSWVERVAAVAADRDTQSGWWVGRSETCCWVDPSWMSTWWSREYTTRGRRRGQAGGSRVRHGAFGTAKWLPPGGGAALDLATARSETHDRAASLPVVERADIHADLQRRDFSINAMALGIAGRGGPDAGPFEAHDPQVAFFVLHERSFEDDLTRGFRAAAWAVRLTLEPQSAVWFTHALETGDGGLEP